MLDRVPSPISSASNLDSAPSNNPTQAERGSTQVHDRQRDVVKRGMGQEGVVGHCA